MDVNNEKMYDLEDYLSYRKLLDESIGNSDQRKRLFFNDSVVHAAMVAESIIRIATQERTPIFMFCGEFSIFRDGFKNKIEKLKERIRPNDGAPDELMEKWKSFDPYTDLIEAMKNYFALEENDLKFELKVEKDISSIRNEDVWNVLIPYYDNKSLSIMLAERKSGLSHFLVSGKAYRKESSDLDKTAICCFDDDRTSQLLISNFKSIKANPVW